MISTILSWIEEYGVESIVVLVVLGAGYILYEQYIKYIFQNKLNKHKSTKKQKEEEIFLRRRRKDDLKSQEFFSNIEFKLNVDIPSEEFSHDPPRSELLRDFMKNLLSAYHSNMMNFVVHLDIEWDKIEWCQELNDTNYKTIDDFKSKCVEQNIPQEAIKRFLVWYTPYMQQIFFYIRKISSMQNKNSVENTNTFLLLLELILMNALSDITKFSAFNGDLDGLEYKGNVIGGNE